MTHGIKYTAEGIEINGALIPLSEIIDRVNAEKIDKNDLALLSIAWPEVRGCEEIFEQIVLPKNKVDRVKSILVGQNVYFGEIAGKHSNVWGDVAENEVEVSTGDAVSKFMKENPSGHVYNHSFLMTFIDSVSCNEEDQAFLGSLL